MTSTPPIYENDKLINFQKKNLKDFNSNDTIYYVRNLNGNYIHFLCEFISFKTSFVTVKPIKCLNDEYYNYKLPKELRGTFYRAYTFGYSKVTKNKQPINFWFDRDGNPIEETTVIGKNQRKAIDSANQTLKKNK